MTPAAPASLPATPREFTWTDEPWGARLLCVPLAAVATHGWTTRGLAIAGGAARCEAQWQQLADTGGVARTGIVAVHQVHGAAVLDADAVASSRGREGDGVMSRDLLKLLTVSVADCAPWLIADSRRGVVAAVHAGWRGTAAGIAGAAVSRMGELFGSHAGDLIAALGPSIGPCCYEVGAELIEIFRERGHRETELDRWFRPGERLRLDLWAAGRDQLEAAGIPAAAILVSGLCTACHLEWFYSYRREGAAAGRLVGFIRASPRDSSAER